MAKKEEKISSGSVIGDIIDDLQNLNERVKLIQSALKDMYTQIAELIFYRRRYKVKSNKKIYIFLDRYKHDAGQWVCKVADEKTGKHYVIQEDVYDKEFTYYGELNGEPKKRIQKAIKKHVRDLQE